MVVVGECPCGSPDPHKKFVRDGKGLHRHGFFSVEAGVEQLYALIAEGEIDPNDRERLVNEVQTSGLLATEEDLEMDAPKSRESLATKVDPALRERIEAGVRELQTQRSAQADPLEAFLRSLRDGTNPNVTIVEI